MKTVKNPAIVFPPEYPQTSKLDAFAVLKPALEAKISAEPETSESDMSAYANDVAAANGFPTGISVRIFVGTALG